MSRHLMYKKHVEKRRIKVGVLATLYILVAVVFTSHQFLNSFGQTGMLEYYLMRINQYVMYHYYKRFIWFLLVSSGE